MTWFLYVVKTVDNFLYTGITTDIERRFKEHQSQGPKTAKYLRSHKPDALVFSCVIGEKSLALKVEYRFKSLTRKRKDLIVNKKVLVFDDSGRITGKK